VLKQGCCSGGWTCLCTTPGYVSAINMVLPYFRCLGEPGCVLLAPCSRAVCTDFSPRVLTQISLCLLWIYICASHAVDGNVASSRSHCCCPASLAVLDMEGSFMGQGCGIWLPVLSGSTAAAGLPGCMPCNTSQLASRAATNTIHGSDCRHLGTVLLSRHENVHAWQVVTMTPDDHGVRHIPRTVL
jgi:hypothetical protein